MGYTLRSGLCFGEVDGRHLIFLDVENDRYFQIPPSWEHDLIDALECGRSGPSTQRLLESGVLSLEESADTAWHKRHIEHPTRSLLEQSSRVLRPSLSVLLEVALLTSWVHVQLRHKPLKHVLNRVISYRDRNVAKSKTTKSTLSSSASQFAQARLYVPIDTRCLPDSLALSIFLSRRRLDASVVIAVAADPFAAHAWVQSGEMILNDSLGAAQAYTPILAV